jgi:hypothetical protein
VFVSVLTVTLVRLDVALNVAEVVVVSVRLVEETV